MTAGVLTDERKGTGDILKARDRTLRSPLELMVSNVFKKLVDFFLGLGKKDERQ